MSGLGVARAATAPTPHDEWAALAPLLAAGGLMRISPDGGRTYPTRKQRPVTRTLPNQPAAVRTYDRTGCAPVLCLDFDSKHGNVDRDVATVAAILDRLSISWFSDSSPNGGRHVYVPLAVAAARYEIETLLRAIQKMCPTLDPTPMLNIAAGCIRPPGAWHRSGGNQRLDQSINRAVEAFRRPADAAAWRALTDRLGAAHASAATTLGIGELVDLATGEVLEPLNGWRRPDADYERIALTGQIPAKYRTGSEARQAVLWACVAAGWELRDVVSRVEDGTWRGLASLYARYAPGSRRKELLSDWRKAHEFEKRRRVTDKKVSVRKCTTSPLKTHRGGVADQVSHRPGGDANEAVRVWLAGVDFLAGHLSTSARAVLYALAQAAVLSGSMEVEFGNRSLAIATGLDQATVGRILVELREAPMDRLLVDLVRPAERTRAATYALVVPPLLAPMCERRPWRRGRVHAIRPVFRELGMIAAFAHMAVENAREPLTTDEVANAAGLSRSAAYDALGNLHAFGIVAKGTDGRWRLGNVNLTRLGEQLGCEEKVKEQTARYRAERLAWWEHLGLLHRLDPAPTDQATIDVDENRQADVVTFVPRRSDDVIETSAPPRAGPVAWFDDTETLLGQLASILGPVEIVDKG